MAKKLNSESNDILSARRKALKNQIAKEFSLVFMGDTHIHMCGSTNQTYYQKVLNTVRAEKQLVAVFNGGDGVDSDNPANMQIFKTATEKILFTGNTMSKIPLFGNVGNHEYHGKSINPIENYNALIGTAGKIQTYRITPDAKNIKVILEVIFLDTGGPDSNGFPVGQDKKFTDQLAAINGFIAKEISKYSKEGKSVRFIIDMHIPPKVGPLGVPSATSKTPHWLREPLNSDFLKLLKKQKNNIVAVVTHHRHCKALKTKYAGVPIFATTHAGQCTFGNTRLEYIRLRLKPAAKSYQITNSKGKHFIVNVQK